MAKSKKKQKVSIVITKDMLIAILVIVLIAAIALATIYFAFPETWDQLVLLVQPSLNNGPKGPNDFGVPVNKGDLNIFFLDVGQGDSILIILPDNKTILIDAGEDEAENIATINNRLSLLGINTLNYVILTHTDSDHCGSLDKIISSVENVEVVYSPKIQTKNKRFSSTIMDESYPTIGTLEYEDFVIAAQEATYLAPDNTRKPTEIKFLEDLQIITDGDLSQKDYSFSYRLAMFCRDSNYYKTFNFNNSGTKNDVSPISILQCNDRFVVLTGDANNSTGEFKKTSSEKFFLNQMQAYGYNDVLGDKNDFDADVLKVAHHGSKGSSGSDFLNFVDCEYAVVSSGGDVINDNGIDEGSGKEEYDLYLSQSYDSQNINIDNFHGNKKHEHPHGDVCKDEGRLEKSGIKECYYTVLHGTIQCTINTLGDILFTPEIKPIISGNSVSFNAAA